MSENPEPAQHAVPNSILVHIGDITVSFAMLESVIQSFIGSLIAEHQRVGQIITAELSFRSLRALAISLYKERHGEDDDFLVLQKAMRRAADLEEKRNQITHSVWAAGPNKNTVTRIKTTAKEKKGINLSFERVDEKILSSVAIEMKVLSSTIFIFHIHLIYSGKAINSPLKKFWPITK